MVVLGDTVPFDAAAKLLQLSLEPCNFTSAAWMQAYKLDVGEDEKFRAAKSLTER